MVHFLGGFSGNSDRYEIERSLLFDGSAYMERTPSVSGNQKTWTSSFWVKRHRIGQFDYLVSSPSVSGNDGIAAIYFGANDELETYYDTSGANPAGPVSPAKYRDPSAWYHIVWAVDAANTVHRVWVNGEELTANGSYFPPNYAYSFNQSGLTHKIGLAAWSTVPYADFSLADFYHVDGQYLTADEFGEVNPLTGQWVPKRYTGIYGTNGFHLPFSNNASLITLGEDASGNGNDWTLNGFTLDDSLVDTPTDNFCTFLGGVSGSAVFSDGNLVVDGDGAHRTGFGSIVIEPDMQAYIEVTADDVTNGPGYGVARPTASTVGTSYTGKWFYRQSGFKFEEASNSALGDLIANGDVIGLAIDRTSDLMTIYINNVSQGTITLPSTGPLVAYYWTYSAQATWNFGQRPFAHTPPAGFKALSTKNLPDPLIPNPKKHFDTLLYQGVAGALSVGGLGFQPDLIWGKNRTTPASHFIVDTERGDGRALFADDAIGEVNNPANYPIVTPDGFDVAASSVTVNSAGDSYAAWCWKRGVTPGFDIISYTGDGVAGRTVAHALGDAPAMMIIKNTNASGNGWAVYHKGVASDPETDFLLLNSTAAASDNAVIWNDTPPTSSVLTLGASGATNESASRDYIAYLFAEIPGFSRFGSYTGNGLADGPFVWCGFKPSFVMTKRANATGNWRIHDTGRSIGNVADERLAADSSANEGAGGSFGPDILSNGFKLRTADAGWNAAGGQYIFAAFAEQPFKTANAR